MAKKKAQLLNDDEEDDVPIFLRAQLGEMH